MHNGQNIQTEVRDPDTYPSNSLTDGEGRTPADSNPDLIGSMTISAYESSGQVPDTYGNARQPENDPNISRPDAITYSYSDTPPNSQAQYVSDKNSDNADYDWSDVTISKGDGLDMEYVVKMEKFADRKLKDNDPAGFYSAIRDIKHGAMGKTLENTYGEKSVLKGAK